MIQHEVEILRAACCIAGLDQKITDREAEMLHRLADRAGVGKVSLEAMINRARTDRNFFEQQFKIIKTDPEATLHVLFCIAAADHELTMDERVVLDYFAKKLGMPAERFAALLQQAQAHIAPKNSRAPPAQS